MKIEMENPRNTALLAALMDAAVDAIIVSDQRGKMVRVSPAAARLFGYDAAQLVGQSVNMLMPESLAGMHDGFMTHHLQTGEQRIIGKGREVEGLRQDGKIIPLHLSVGSAEVEDRKMFVAILHDLTERHAAKAALARSQRLDAIGQLTGGIAHDFNNLLNAIAGHCDLMLLRHDRNDPDYADLVQINQNTNRAAALVGQLLAFSRKQTLEPEIIDLRDTMGELTHLLNRLVGERITLTLTHDPGLYPIRADRRQLDQVIMNLVVNARDAMPDGGEIRVETQLAAS
jgi:PAS domain S-box-containing protein